ncbi:hypothetical protein EVJ24_12465 [Exiguobacterium sp. SH1S21]|uniref:hypothetical protein n=1 Tax=Exiguobacterium sp. SH1S21 TaxID=2510953 RepID=UPI001040AB8A|nr:hypothetical protein [Exiguobacterium sp. SH1S21]TCI51939.1 hypothetical protein EVJ24_12465 [Exiguobacterium sp. SH1S21]
MSTSFTIWTKRLVVTAIIVGVVLFSTIACQRVFNMSEINLLVDKADEQHLSYELIIHNPFTNAYSFDIIDD